MFKFNFLKMKKTADEHPSICPRCLEKMGKVTKRNVEIEMCPKCNMILLEKQDLDDLFKDYKKNFRKEYIEKNV